MRIKVLKELILEPKKKSKVSIYWDKRIPRENTTLVDTASFQNDVCVVSPDYLHNLERKRPQLEVENKSDVSTITSGDPEEGPLGYSDFVAFPSQEPASLINYFKLGHLNEEQKDAIAKVLEENEKAILTPGKSLGCTDLIEFSVELEPNAKPIALPPYRIPHIATSQR